MQNNTVLGDFLEIEEKNKKLPPLSVEEAESFDIDNMMGSVFYSNLLEGNTLPREEALCAMLGKDDDQ